MKFSGFSSRDVHVAYTRFCKVWIVGEWQCDGREGATDHLRILAKDGGSLRVRLTTGVSCLGRMHALLLTPE